MKSSAGNKYRDKWEYDKVAGEWIGNPATDADVVDLKKALTNKTHLQGNREKHSIAMSYEKMQKIFTWSEQLCANEGVLRETGKEPTMPQRTHETQHLMLRAFASTAFTIWTR